MNLTEKQINTIKVLVEFLNDEFVVEVSGCDIINESATSEMREYLSDLNKLAEIYRKIPRQNFMGLTFKWALAYLSLENTEQFAHRLSQTIEEMENK